VAEWIEMGLHLLGEPKTVFKKLGEGDVLPAVAAGINRRGSAPIIAKVEARTANTTGIPV